MGIKLIVGLGNPGLQYANTRHNVGAWFVASLAAQYEVKLQLESAFKGYVATIKILDCKLLVPTTFMNLSGDAVLACARYYKILAPEIMVVHDELDFLPGIIRLKQGGGANGHNGVQNIIERFKSNDFWRLRIGIGKPTVANYVLTKPTQAEEVAIKGAITKALLVIPELLSGKVAQAMQRLHTSTE